MTPSDAPIAAPPPAPAPAERIAIDHHDTTSPLRPAPRPLPWPWILAFAIPPVLFAALQLGRWHPDEVYQYLEPAFFRVHGFGIRAWEWQVGLRNWASPIVLSWFLRLAEGLGIHDPRGWRLVIALPMLALHVALLASAFRYVERRLPDRRWPTYLAFTLVAAMAPVLMFSGRTMGETISTAFLVVAADRLDRHARSERGARPWIDGAIGGVCLGLSVVARYGSAVFVLAALLWLVATRRFRVLVATCASGIVIAAGLGALDWETWGAPFHSLRAYIDFNLVSGHAVQQFGSQPWWYFLPLLLVYLAPWAWPGTIAAVRAERRLPLPTWMGAAYLIAVSITPHKEERFLYPAVVLLALGAATGLASWLERVQRPRLRAALTAFALVTGASAFFVHVDFKGDEFRAYVRATRSESATGILVVGEGIWGSGGYFYLGRNIPLYNGDLPQQIVAVLQGDPRVNRVISFKAMNADVIEAQGFTDVDRVGRFHIYEKRP